MGDAALGKGIGALTTGDTRGPPRRAGPGPLRRLSPPASRRIPPTDDDGGRSRTTSTFVGALCRRGRHARALSYAPAGRKAPACRQQRQPHTAGRTPDPYATHTLEDRCRRLPRQRRAVGTCDGFERRRRGAGRVRATPSAGTTIRKNSRPATRRQRDGHQGKNDLRRLLRARCLMRAQPECSAHWSRRSTTRWVRRRTRNSKSGERVFGRPMKRTDQEESEQGPLNRVPAAEAGEAMRWRCSCHHDRPATTHQAVMRATAMIMLMMSSATA